MVKGKGMLLKIDFTRRTVNDWSSSIATDITFKGAGESSSSSQACLKHDDHTVVIVLLYAQDQHLLNVFYLPPPIPKALQIDAGYRDSNKVNFSIEWHSQLQENQIYNIGPFCEGCMEPYSIFIFFFYFFC